MDRASEDLKRETLTAQQTPRKNGQGAAEATAEDLQRTVSVAQRARKASTSQSDSVKRGKIRVIKSKLPMDFFSKLSEAVPESLRNPEKQDTPNFTRKQPAPLSSRSPASIHELMESFRMQPQADSADCQQQTANFFYFSSSQSTCDAEESADKPSLLVLKKWLPMNRRNSRSKAEYCRPSEQTPLVRPCGETLEIRTSEPRCTEFKLDLGCTFSRDIKKHFSTPQSPNHYDPNPSEKLDVLCGVSRDLMTTRNARKLLNSQRPSLIRERFGSKQLRNTKERMANNWKEPLVPGKNLQLPPIQRP